MSDATTSLLTEHFSYTPLVRMALWRRAVENNPS